MRKLLSSVLATAPANVQNPVARELQLENVESNIVIWAPMNTASAPPTAGPPTHEAAQPTNATPSMLIKAPKPMAKANVITQQQMVANKTW